VALADSSHFQIARLDEQDPNLAFWSHIEDRQTPPPPRAGRAKLTCPRLHEEVGRLCRRAELR